MDGYKRIAFVAGLLILSLIVTGGGVFGQAPQAIVFGTPEDMDNLDPHVTTMNCNMRLIYLIYDGLCQFGSDPSTVDPMLATSWEASDDGLSWIFQLRDDAYFEDGTHFDSSVAKFSFERLLGVGGGPSSPYQVIEEILAPEPYTLKFVLKEPFGPFIWTMCSVFCRIVPPSVTEHEKDGDWGQAWLADHSLGSGPFRLKSWEKGQRVVLEAKKDYWGGAPKLDEVIVRTIMEPATRKMELLAGTIDMAEQILIEDLDELIAAEGVKVFKAPSFHINYLYFDTQNPPFNDSRVRKAVAYALDYDALIDGIMKGWAVPHEGPVPIGMWGRDDRLDGLYTRRLPLARQLLAEAGYPDGFTTTFTLAPLGNWPQIATLVQSYLADIGITVKIEQYSWPTYIAKALGHEVELGIIGITPDYPDPDMFAWMLYHSTSELNLSNYQSEEIDRILDEARTLSEQDERDELYKEFHWLQHELVLVVYLYQDLFRRPMRTWVEGYYYNPNMQPLIPFQDMWVER